MGDRCVGYPPLCEGRRGPLGAGPPGRVHRKLTSGAASSQGTCDFITIDNVPPLPPTYVVACRLGDLPVWEEGNVGTQATITIRLVPTTTGLIRHQAIARAENVPSVEEYGDLVVDRASSPPPGGEPGGESGDRVLVEHKGKELCLPEAALKGHLKHGDEVLDEEGCSDTDQGSRGGSKKLGSLPQVDRKGVGSALSPTPLLLASIQGSAWKKGHPRESVVASPAGPLGAWGGAAGGLGNHGSHAGRIRGEESLRAVATCYARESSETLPVRGFRA